jgi:bifunctional non-homologous end joining protein LigD
MTPAGTAVELPAGGGRSVRMSNPEKVLYPASGFTKRDVAEYYANASAALLAHLKGRPVTLKRYPNGVEGISFYEKRCPEHRPDWVATAAIPSDRHGIIDFCLVKDTATLLWLANLAVLELHTLLARSDHPQRPTMMVFDLDPGPPATLFDCIPLALEMRDLLARLDLQSFAKTSGGKGLHLYVPLNTPRVSFDDTKHFAHAMAMMLEKNHPKLVVSQMKKELRKGKILIDWSQNDNHKTTVCAYALRARTHPTVSTPLKWREIEQADGNREKTDALRFEVPDVLKRLKKFGDLFEPVLTVKQKLPKLDPG